MPQKSEKYNFEQVNFCLGSSTFIELIPLFSLTILQAYVYSTNQILTIVLNLTYFSSVLVVIYGVFWRNFVRAKLNFSNQIKKIIP